MNYFVSNYIINSQSFFKAILHKGMICFFLIEKEHGFRLFFRLLGPEGQTNFIRPSLYHLLLYNLIIINKKFQ